MTRSMSGENITSCFFRLDSTAFLTIITNMINMVNND